MKMRLPLTLCLLIACLLTSCSKPEPPTMVTFSVDEGKLRHAFKMSGEVVNQPLEEAEAGLRKFRFVVEEGEWVDFVVDEDKQALTYQANFSETPHYKFDFAETAGNHHFYMPGDPETHYLSKFLNAPDQGGTVHWK